MSPSTKNNEKKNTLTIDSVEKVNKLLMMLLRISS